MTHRLCVRSVTLDGLCVYRNLTLRWTADHGGCLSTFVFFCVIAELNGYCRVLPLGQGTVVAVVLAASLCLSFIQTFSSLGRSQLSVCFPSDPAVVLCHNKAELWPLLLPSLSHIPCSVLILFLLMFVFPSVFQPSLLSSDGAARTNGCFGSCFLIHVVFCLCMYMYIYI